MLWLLALHIVFMVCWFAGLFYLPRLFVYHADSSDTISLTRFNLMEHRLFYYIMTPAGLLTTLSGIGLLIFHGESYFKEGWFITKLMLVTVLWYYHLYCGKLLSQFKFNKNSHSSTFYRFFNEIPSILLLVIVMLAVVKP